MKCIYAIKDLRDDHIIYIGKTKDFKRRKANHFCKKKCPIDLYMFNEGRDNFSMDIIIEYIESDVSDEDLLKLENWFIEKYDTLNNGFNIRRSGGISKNIKEYRFQNKEYFKEYKKEYYSKNKEYFKEHIKEYYSKNKEYKKEYNRQYRLQNKEYFKEYRLQNKDRHTEYMRQYRLKKKLEKQENGRTISTDI